MNTFKSILSVALLVSGMSAAAWELPGKATVNAIANSKAVEKAAFALAAAKGNVAPFCTKKVGASVAAAAAVTTAGVFAYKNGLFGKAAQAISNGAKTVKNAVSAKFTSKK